jgi:DNA-binding NarL/FixJ family response regulator
MTQKCALELQRGDLFAAIRFGEQGVSMGLATGSPLAQIAPIQLAEALLEIGEPERARRELVGADGPAEIPAFAPHQARAYELLSRIELAQDGLDQAAVLADRATEVASHLGLALPTTHALRARARVSLARGRPEEAATHAEAAVDAATSIGACVDAAIARSILGTGLAAAGRRADAVDQLRTAHGELARCGATHFADRAARELRRLGHVVPRPAARSDDDALPALTARELEVLDLLATGMTNRAIAERLVLSVRTVDRHVARLYEKLDVHSRAAAAARYARQRATS